MALGGGCEVCLACDAICAHRRAPTWGWWSSAPGVIPAGGGTTNTLDPLAGGHPRRPDRATGSPSSRRPSSSSGWRRSAFSAEMARDYKYLRQGDRVVMDRDELSERGEEDGPRPVDAGGYRATCSRPDNLVLPWRAGVWPPSRMGLNGMLLGGYVTEYEFHIATKLATGADGRRNRARQRGQRRSELLELEVRGLHEPRGRSQDAGADAAPADEGQATAQLVGMA